MEDGELEETMSELDPGHRGPKRNQSVLDDDEEETLSIKPPPVSNKKHKRHHKKHKLKEEKKKKKHRDHHNRNIRDKDVVLECEKLERDKHNYDNQGSSSPPIRRTPDPAEPSKRKDNYGKPFDRLQRSFDSRNSDERGKAYTYKPHEKDYLPSRGDSKYDRQRIPGYFSAGKLSHRERMPVYPPKREEREYDPRGAYKVRKEESYSRGKEPLLRRQFDDDDEYDRRIIRHSGYREDKGNHSRSVSSSVVVRSMPSSVAKLSRKSDSSLSSTYKNRMADDVKNNANGQKRKYDDRPLSRKTSPMSNKPKMQIESNPQFVSEIVSSEDSSESSGSSSNESEEEVELIKHERRKKDPQLPKQYQDESKTPEEDSSSEEENEEEEEEENLEEESSSGEDAGSDEPAASNSSVASISGNSEDEEAEEDESINESNEDNDDEDDNEQSFQNEESGFEGEDQNYTASDLEDEMPSPEPSPLDKGPELPFYYPALQGCRSVDEFQCLNRIEEGTYGVVYRAKDKKTDEVVALKRLKMEKEKEGFPITSLREVCTLLKAHHPNIVRVQEIVVGSNVDKIYIVMDYVEHDLKSLMETMKQPFLIGEVKTLLIQLLRGVHHLHDNWILHRDLKTSNLLLSHRGILKIGDFGLAREYGSPLKPYTPIVVTLWYRSPELLLGTKEYSTAIDIWSVGCIFAEFLSKKPLFPGKSEIMQLNLIFKELGTPSEKIWPGYNDLPIVKKTTFSDYPYNTLRKRFGATDISEKGFDLLNRFLTYCPEKRISAFKALQHEWFTETPKPVEPSMFPTWPAKSEQARVKRKTDVKTPKAPEGAMGYNKLLNEEEKLGFQLTAPEHGLSKHGTGFSLKF
ncbi:uncharacterized protein LOC143461600 isoform X2 [Clavelina lepadiformis]|uniref:uncharacterized protein LOC143461600 isoform X2 n=1 Tax=Clavelina lepadiformis TaxID=159417 RepID=UPI0040425A5E